MPLQKIPARMVETATVPTLAANQTFSGNNTFSGTLSASSTTTLSGSTTISGTLTCSNAAIIFSAAPTHADNAAATGAGLAVNRVYKTATGELRIVV